jgi:hypothetical protein
LGPRGLQVQSTEHAAPGTRVIVLHELRRDPGYLEIALDVKGLDEEAALIAVHDGLDENHAGQLCLRDLQTRSSKPSR